jgi:methylase of polypeptide subunit release factors
MMTLRPPSPESAKRIREFFRDCGYNTKMLMARFGLAEISSVHLLRIYRRGPDLDSTPLNLLLQWFWIGKDVPHSTAVATIPPDVLSALLTCELLRAEDHRLVSAVRVAPFAEFLIISDHAESHELSMRPDTILWPNPTTLLCYHLALKNSVASTLDLGTGSGVLAIAAAANSGSVIATDLNPRARTFALFNAALNGVANVEFREGNSFEPVRGVRFDRILANPPFFVSPSLRRIYSDNDMELDGFCRNLIRQAPSHLNPGGYCQMLLEWVQIKGQPWRERLSAWVEGLGCDAWIINTYIRSAADYAIVRVQEDRDETPDLAVQATMTSQWQRYFQERDVESIHGGVIILRLREGKNWLRMEELPVRPERPFGEYLRRVFENQDFLEAHPTADELLPTCPALHQGSVLHKQFSQSPEGWRIASLELRLSEGLPYSVALQPNVAEFLGSCDGSRTLDEVTAGIAQEAGVALELVRQECCAVARQLAQRGFLFFT